ncbi:hypothetical protein L195_g025395, partial [Trifolium pratense]
RAWGSVCLSIAFIWQLYTIFLLIELHESASSGKRHSRYLFLAMSAFGDRLGKLAALFPVMYLSGGTCVILIITGGGTMKQLFKILCENDNGVQTCTAHSLSGVEWFLVFTCAAILVAQLPNLNSVAAVSLLGAVASITYCTLFWSLSVKKGRPEGVSYSTTLVSQESTMVKISDIINAIGIIVLSFRGHNVVLEIQGTLPSNFKETSKEPMRRGVTISYILIAACVFPLAIAGFWAYGNQIPDRGLLMAFPQFQKQEVTKFTIAVTFPFLPSLAALLGGITIVPVTYAYPCFMWLAIKKPRTKGAIWCFNLILGCLGMVLSALLVAAAIRNLADKGLHANFFKP